MIQNMAAYVINTISDGLDVLTCATGNKQSPHCKFLARMLREVQLHDLSATDPTTPEGKDAIMQEIVLLKDLHALIVNIMAHPRPIVWIDLMPNLHTVLLLSATSLQYRIQTSIAVLQARVHNFEPDIMEAIGYDLERLLG